jgi:hypothetical protein
MEIVVMTLMFMIPIMNAKTTKEFVKNVTADIAEIAVQLATVICKSLFNIQLIPPFASL